MDNRLQQIWSNLQFPIYKIFVNLKTKRNYSIIPKTAYCLHLLIAAKLLIPFQFHFNMILH